MWSRPKWGSWVLGACAVVVGGACSDAGADAVKGAEACGEQKCPVGTAQEERASVTSGTDISGGYDPATYKAEGAYSRMGTGSCEYICRVIQACPDGFFPVITETCFTCGAILPDNTVDKATCQ